jgi:hypothetical protein
MARKRFPTFMFREATFRIATPLQGERAQKWADEQNGKPVGEGRINNSFVECREPIEGETEEEASL